MEIENLYDFDDIESEDITIALVRLTKTIPDHEFFFKINRLNDLNFTRIDDVVFHGEYYEYFFPRYQAYHKNTKTYFTFFSNRSSVSIQKKEHTELFGDEKNIKFLLNNYPDVDYIIHSSDQFPDFFVISFPEDLVFSLQDYNLNSEEELYQTIQYYE